MQRFQEMGDLISRDEFMRKVAGNVVRQANSAEGLECWLQKHSGSLQAPSHATRRYAYDLFGDSMAGCLFNACLVLEVDRLTRSGRVA